MSVENRSEQLREMSNDQLASRRSSLSSGISRVLEYRDSIGKKEFIEAQRHPDLVIDNSSDTFVDDVIRVGEIQQSLDKRTLPALTKLIEGIDSVLVEKNREIQQWQERVEKLEALKEGGYLPSDEALSEARKRLSELQSSEPVPAPRVSKTSPELSKQIKKDPVQKPRREIKKRSELFTFSVQLPNGEVFKAVGEVARVLQAITKGQWKTYEQLCRELFGDFNPKLRSRVAGYLTAIDKGLKPYDQKVSRRSPMNDDNQTRVTQIRLALKKIETPKQATNKSNVLPPERGAGKRQEIAVNPVTQTRLHAIKAILENDNISDEEIIKMLGLSKKGRKLTWPQAASAIRLAAGVLAKRVDKGIATPEELEVWNLAITNSEESTTSRQVSKAIAERAKNILDPKIKLLRAYESPVVTENHSQPQHESNNEVEKEHSTETTTELTEGKGARIDEVVTTPLPYVETPRQEKGKLVEKRIPNIRGEINSVAEIARKTGLSRIGHAQLPAIFRISTYSVIRVQERDEVKPGPGRFDKHHPSYTLEETVAVVIFNKYGEGLSKRERKEINQLIEEEFKEDPKPNNPAK